MMFYKLHLLLPFFWVLWGMIVFIYYSSFLEITLQSVHLINFENSSKIFLNFELLLCFVLMFLKWIHQFIYLIFLQISYYLYFNVSPRKGRYRSLGSVCNLYVEDLASFHLFLLCNHLFFNLFDIEIFNNVIIKNPLFFIFYFFKSFTFYILWLCYKTIIFVFFSSL